MRRRRRGGGVGSFVVDRRGRSTSSDDLEVGFGLSDVDLRRGLVVGRRRFDDPILHFESSFGDQDLSSFFRPTSLKIFSPSPDEDPYSADEFSEDHEDGVDEALPALGEEGGRGGRSLVGRDDRRVDERRRRKDREGRTNQTTVPVHRLRKGIAVPIEAKNTGERM